MVGQIVAALFMQVFIEHVRRYQRAMVTVHLCFVGMHYLEFKYPNGLMQQGRTRISNITDWITRWHPAGYDLFNRRTPIKSNVKRLIANPSEAFQ
jgi:hypothetical protein